MKRDAFISECGQFRYYLLRQWDGLLPLLVFVLLNPSTADAHIDDNTVKKCIAFARALGFGGIVILNLFAYRATKPKDLRRAGYPVGPLNDEFIRLFTTGAAVIAGWGANARGHPRAAEVLRMIPAPHALRLLADGIPEHPLYLPAALRTFPI